MSTAISFPVAKLIIIAPFSPIDDGLTSETYLPLDRSTISVFTLRLTNETIRESVRYF